MTKSLKESQSFDIVSGKEFGRETAVHSLDTLAEDNAFMKRMETIPFKNMNKEELQKIYRIALKGLKVQSKLDKALADIRVHEHEKKQSGTLNNGLKYHEIFKRGREMLMQIREGNQ